MATAPQKRKVSFQKTEATTGNHNWAQCREKQIKGDTAPVDTTTSQLLLLYDLGKHRQKEQAKRSQDPEYEVAYKELHKQSKDNVNIIRQLI